MLDLILLAVFKPLPQRHPKKRFPRISDQLPLFLQVVKLECGLNFPICVNLLCMKRWERGKKPIDMGRGVKRWEKKKKPRVWLKEIYIYIYRERERESARAGKQGLYVLPFSSSDSRLRLGLCSRLFKLTLFTLYYFSLSRLSPLARARNTYDEPMLDGPHMPSSTSGV